jgi:hypothetical protein
MGERIGGAGLLGWGGLMSERGERIISTVPLLTAPAKEAS